MQNFLFDNVPTSEDDVYTYAEITGIDISLYKELVFAFNGTITLSDISTNTLPKYRTSIFRMHVVNKDNDTKSIFQEVAKLYNTQTGPVTETMNFNARVRLYTDISTHDYIKGSGAIGYHYYGLSMQSIKSAFDGQTLDGNNFVVKISHTASTGGTEGNAIAKVVGSVSVYGKRGL